MEEARFNMKSASQKRTIETVLFTALGIVVALIMIFPIIWLLFSSFKPRAELFAYPLQPFPGSSGNIDYSGDQLLLWICSGNLQK